MATSADGPRSSSSGGGGGGGGGGSADSYIGSLISLTSKSEIRYEGILYNINAQDSTIGLSNVRSFGTEGRKKDGPQVPPGDKIYDYILFRGSDIKDLQVKSSPPVQTKTQIHNDPAIIQATTAPTSLPFGTTSVTDLSSHTSSIAQPIPSFQGSLPLYQPSGNVGSWGPSPTSLNTNENVLPMPMAPQMYWPGYYGPSNALQAQQPTLLQPPRGLSMQPSLQQSMQYPATNTAHLSVSQSAPNPPPLLPAGTLNLQSSTLPAQSSLLVSDSANIIRDKASSQTLPTTLLSSNLALASSLMTTVDKSAISSAGSDKPKAALDQIMPSKSVSEPFPSIVGTPSSVLNEASMPSLVTPGQFLQPGPLKVPSLQSSQTGQKDVEVVQVSSSRESPPPLLPPSTAAVPEVKEPILPLPSPPQHRSYGASMQTYHTSRGGRERGRGNGFSRSATRFTEDFDFTAMNDKFNKDEVWGHLSKNNKSPEDGGDLQEEDDDGLSKLETNPVYVKDDFFDSLSCDAIDGGSRNGRTRFSEQLKKDTETFGDFNRHWGGRGRWGPGRGGRFRGGYHGRGYGYGYGYGGRGRGYNM